MADDCRLSQPDSCHKLYQSVHLPVYPSIYPYSSLSLPECVYMCVCVYINDLQKDLKLNELISLDTFKRKLKDLEACTSGCKCFG